MEKNILSKQLLLILTITLSSLLSQYVTTDLTKEIIDSLNNDHLRMKGFKENFRRMSCKLLVVSKIRALYETEELDKYTNRTTPESRPKYVDKLREEYYDACMLTYREDKLIFEKEMFYSYPQDDSKYQKYLNVSLETLLEEFPKFNQTEWDLANKVNEKKDSKKKRGAKKDEEDL